MKSSERGQLQHTVYLCKSGLKRHLQPDEGHRHKSRVESMFESHFRLQSLFVFRELGTLPYRGSERGGLRLRRLKENVSDRKENSASNFKSVEPADIQSVWNVM